ncbi:MAG TPA: tetratricopeptide repeat protein, partial [Candidatus Brocadiia bacterium]|nr:tetratricopeptide repeat protein [Candidatus Brocadiia bacterium]
MRLTRPGSPGAATPLPPRQACPPRPGAPLALAALFCLLALTACQTERLIERSKPEPAWRHWGDMVEGDRRYYVGVSTADNTLDEHSARLRARMSACERISESIALEAARLSRGAPLPGGALPSQFHVSYQNQIRNATVEDWYFEKWRIRPHWFSPPFDRWKCFVLVAYPTSEFNNAAARAAEEAGSDLNLFLARIQSALAQRRLADALREAQSATLRCPREFSAWWALYEVQTARGAHDEALAALRAAQVQARDDLERQAAGQAILQTRDSQARQIEHEAALARSQGRLPHALDLLEKAWRAAGDAALRDRLSQTAYDILAAQAAQAVQQASQTHGPVALSTFAPEDGATRAETSALRSSIARILAAQGRPLLIHDIDPGQAQRFSRGDWTGSDTLRRQLEAQGIRSLVLGRVGSTINIHLANLASPQTLLLAAGPRLDPARGSPESPLWDRFQAVAPANPKAPFLVSLWTAEREYPIGARLRVQAKASRDCHLYVFSVPTSGG